MKKIIRLTESELHGIIQRSVLNVLREQNDEFLLQQIAQEIAQKRIYVRAGENQEDVELQGDTYAEVRFTVESDPYIKVGMKSNDYDVPDDPDEIIDNPSVIVDDITIIDADNESRIFQDNGIVKQALEKSMRINYDGYIPTEEDYWDDFEE